MNKLVLIISLLLYFTNILNAQLDSCIVSIHLKWSDENNNHYSKYLNNIPLKDTFKVKFEKDYNAKIFLYDCKGEMYLKLYKNQTLIKEGNYINSLDTLKMYAYNIDPFDGKIYILVRSYFEPLKCGTWIYYDEKGRFLNEAKFEVLLADTIP